jgi:hypothetical protein
MKLYSIYYARKEKKTKMSKILKFVSSIVVFLFFITEMVAVEPKPYRYKLRAGETGGYRHILRPTLTKCTTPKDCEDIFIPPYMKFAICKNGVCGEYAFANPI